jgi:hypothetical protein
MGACHISSRCGRQFLAAGHASYQTSIQMFPIATCTFRLSLS